MDALRRADSRIALEKTQVVSDVVDQIDGQLDDHIRELKEQSKVECDLLKRELERVYEEKVRIVKVVCMLVKVASLTVKRGLRVQEIFHHRKCLNINYHTTQA